MAAEGASPDETNMAKVTVIGGVQVRQIPHPPFPFSPSPCQSPSGACLGFLS